MNRHTIIIPDALRAAAIAGRITKWVSQVPEEAQNEIQEVPYFTNPLGVPGDEIYLAEELRGDGQPGNRRVGIMRYGFDGEMVLPCAKCGKVICKHSYFVADVVWPYTTNSRSAKQMPRWASRRFWRNTGVEVKQRKEITVNDLIAMGFESDWQCDDIFYDLFKQFDSLYPDYSPDTWMFVTSMEAI